MFSIPSSSPTRGFHSRSPLSPTILSTSPCVVFPAPQRLLPSPNRAQHPCRAPPLPCAARVLLGSSSRCSPWPRGHRPRPALPCPAWPPPQRPSGAAPSAVPQPGRALLPSGPVRENRELPWLTSTSRKRRCRLKVEEDIFTSLPLVINPSPFNRSNSVSFRFNCVSFVTSRSTQ